MLDKTIEIMEKEKNEYDELYQNTDLHAKNRATTIKLKERIKKEIRLRDFILNILEEQKK